jgi:hypothetical protein
LAIAPAVVQLHFASPEKVCERDIPVATYFISMGHESRIEHLGAGV